jgi:methionyl-tRNA formyltransferase
LTAPLRIVFAGTPEFSVPALEALDEAGHAVVAVYTQPDRPAGRGRALAASPVKRRAIELAIPVEQPATLKDASVQAGLAAYVPDLMVVVAYGLLLPQAVLDIPRRGCLNIHASLLPRWRGAAPIQRAVLAGDEITGVTIMKMDVGLDTGPELLRKTIAIEPRDTGGTLHDKLSPLGARAVVEAIDGWVAGQLQLQPQAVEGVSYATKLRKDEAEIDWTRSAVEIDRQVRAFNPRPVAETTLQGEQVRIWDAQPVALAAEPAASAASPEAFAQPHGGLAPASPGTVAVRQGRIHVATGAGWLELLRLQLPGRKPVFARDFMNARSLAGARFGDAS